VRRGGLGRGLSALIPGAVEERGLLEVPIDAIEPNPKQPRTGFDEDALASLAASIQEVGLLQPVIVRPRNTGFELIAGERRLRAAKRAGLATIPAVVRDSDDTDSLREGLMENIHREDLGPLELAAAFQELLDDLGATQESVADRLGCSRAHVANTIRLLTLPPDVQRLLNQGRIQAGHGRALLALPDDEARSSLALRIAAEGLSVREVERLVKAYAAPTARRAAPARRDPSLDAVQEALSDRLATRVLVTMGRRKGKIVVEFASADDLQRLVDELLGTIGSTNAADEDISPETRMADGTE
jgi:ParB family chromosome partitioning protein